MEDTEVDVAGDEEASGQDHTAATIIALVPPLAGALVGNATIVEN